MKLEAIIAAVQRDFGRMQKVYRRPIFDEWAIVRFTPAEDSILHYTGPRSEAIGEALASDLQALRGELAKGRHLPGQFEFARAAAGTAADAFLALGEDVYLICNHTTKTMNEITADPLWTAAQVPFVDLSERIAADPIEL